MDRRVFIGGLALGTLAARRTAPAQPARKIARIGILVITEPSDIAGPQPRHPSVNALLRRLRELGYAYGEHFVTEARQEANPERFPGLAAELVHLQVDVIVAPGPMLPALKQATSRIPIVMAAAPDPIRDGFVRSLRHPGGNFTGLSLGGGELNGKRLELLKELVPAAALVAVLWEPFSLPGWQAAEVAARKRGWKLLSLEVRNAGEIEGAFRTATEARAGALLVVSGGLLLEHARRVAELAVKSRLPAMYPIRPHVEAGGLISYSADLIEIWRQSAVFVTRS